MTEAQTVGMFINSEDGQEARETNPKGVMNVELHGMEHKQAMAAAAGAQPQKPVAKSLSLGDLLKAGMTDEAMQLLKQAGINAPVAPPQAAAPGPNASPNPTGQNAPGTSPAAPAMIQPVINPKPPQL
jgi:hypothetical protein